MEHLQGWVPGCPSAGLGRAGNDPSVGLKRAGEQERWTVMDNNRNNAGLK